LCLNPNKTVAKYKTNKRERNPKLKKKKRKRKRAKVYWEGGEAEGSDFWRVS
jgi:hypothetical protein